MKSGLEGRNNWAFTRHDSEYVKVSMKSGLEGRNNTTVASSFPITDSSQ